MSPSRRRPLRHTVAKHSGILAAALLCVSCASRPAPHAASPATTPAGGVTPSALSARAGVSNANGLPSSAASASSESSARKPPAIPVAVAERTIGEVRMIGGSAQRFVLIEIPWNISGLPLDSGQELRCRAPAAQGGEQTALVRVGRERRQQFVVADIVSGQPKIGDSVFLSADRHSSAPPLAPLPMPPPGAGMLFPPPAAALGHP